LLQTYLLTPSLLHFALGRGFEIAQRCSFEIFLGPIEDRFVNLTYGALQHNFKGRSSNCVICDAHNS
jgi:hypothetical protein